MQFSDILPQNMDTEQWKSLWYNAKPPFCPVVTHSMNELSHLILRLESAIGQVWV